MFAQIVKRGFHPTRQSAARLTTLVAPKRHLPTQLLSRPLQQQQQHHHQQQRTNGVVSLFPTLHQQQQQRFSSTPSTSDSPPPTTSTAFPGDGQTSSGAAAAAAGSAAAGGSGGTQQTSTAQKVKVKIKAKKKIQIIDENIEIMNTELFPEGVPEHLTKELKHLNHPDVASWVKRKLTDDIVRRLEARVSLEKQDKKEYDPDLDLNEGVVVLAGTREVGKSVVLCQVVQWARNNGWIVLYSPNSGSLLRSGVQIYPSRHNEGYFDQPDIAGPLLANFRKAHARQLNKLPYQGEPRPTYLSERKRKEDVRKEKTGKSGDLNAVTLLDVVDHGLLGLGGSDAATSYRDLREQLSIVESEEAKILFVIDDVNTLYSNTVFGYEMKPVEGDMLTLSSTLRPFDQNGLRENFAPKRGAVLCATTGTSENLPSAKRVRKEAGAMYDYLSPVRPYDREEFDAAIRMYVASGLMGKNCFREINSKKEKRSELVVADIEKARVQSSQYPGVLYEHVVQLEMGGF